MNIKYSLRLLLPALTALLLILSYPLFNCGALAWFALGPLVYYVLASKTLKTALAGGAVSGFIFYLGLLYWIYPTMRAGGAGPAVSVLALVLLAALLSLEFLLMSGLGFFLKKAPLSVFPYAFSAAWAAMEWGKVCLAAKAVWFPWFTLAYTQWQRPELIQIVSVTGLYGLSFAVCFCGALAGAVFYGGTKPLRSALRFLPAPGLVLCLWLYGASELKKADAAVFKTPFRAVLLQPCIDIYAKWDAAQAGNIKKKIDGMVRGLKGADLVVWPENALPGWIDDARCANWVADLAGNTRSVHFVGSVSRGDGRHVAAFLIDPSGTIKGEYNKRLLVPFGEYVPFRTFLGRFIEPVAALGEFSPGARRQPLMEFGRGPMEGVKAAGIICYESVFPFLARSDAAVGAELFINITNDGWYLDTAAPYQHLLVNIFRAVETRRPVLRAANNGISAYIDPWGRVRSALGLNNTGVLNIDVRLAAGPGQSFYVRHRDMFALICLLAGAGFILVLTLKKAV